MSKLRFYTVKDEYIGYLRQFDRLVIDNKDKNARHFDRKYLRCNFCNR